MSDSRKTPIFWGTGVAIFLIAYVASPPLWTLVLKGAAPSPPLDTILEVAYWPLKILYDTSPWYKQYIDVTYEMAMP